MARSEELPLAGSGRQGGHLLHVAHHHLLEAELHVAGQDGVSRGAHQQLGARALGDCPDGAEMFWELRLAAARAQVRLELDHPPVLAAARDDTAIL